MNIYFSQVVGNIKTSGDGSKCIRRIRLIQLTS